MLHVSACTLQLRVHASRSRTTKSTTSTSLLFKKSSTMNVRRIEHFHSDLWALVLCLNVVVGEILVAYTVMYFANISCFAAVSYACPLQTRPQYSSRFDMFS